MLPIFAFSSLNHADRLFKAFDFANAAQAYETYYKKHPSEVAVAEKIATCYRLMNNWEQAEPWYEIVSSTDGADPMNIYYYAQAARFNENYTVSNEMFNRHYQVTGDADSKAMVLSQEEFDILFKPKDYNVSMLEINSERTDFGPALYEDKMYFASNRDTKKFTGVPGDNWVEGIFLQMHMVDTVSDISH